MSDLDTLVEITSAAEKAQAEREEDLRIRLKLDEFLQRNIEAVRQWAKAHPGERPPVYYSREEDRVIWLNRKQRKAIAKRARASSNHLKTKVKTHSSPTRKVSN